MSDSQHAGGPSHSAQSSIATVNDIASPGGSPSLSHGSFEERRAFDSFGDKKVRRRAGGEDDCNEDYDKDDDDDASDHDHQEHERLLADDTAALDARSQHGVAATLPHDGV